MREVLRTLVIRPPAHVFATADDPDEVPFNVTLTAWNLGQRFNEPLPTSLASYPNHSTEFSASFVRVNSEPRLFVESSHFTASQDEAFVGLPGTDGAFVVGFSASSWLHKWAIGTMYF